MVELSVQGLPAHCKAVESESFGNPGKVLKHAETGQSRGVSVPGVSKICNGLGWLGRLGRLGRVLAEKSVSTLPSPGPSSLSSGDCGLTFFYSKALPHCRCYSKYAEDAVKWKEGE